MEEGQPLVDYEQSNVPCACKFKVTKDRRTLLVNGTEDWECKLKKKSKLRVSLEMLKVTLCVKITATKTFNLAILQ